METRLSFEKVWPWALKFVHIYQLKHRIGLKSSESRCVQRHV